MIRDFSKSRTNNGIMNLVDILDSYSFGDECVEYTYRLNKDGYSALKMNDKMIRAHRFAYHWYHTIPVNDALCVMHKCDNPSCINPKHLKLGTWSDNNRDRACKNRTVCFSFYRRKLTKEDVDYIKTRFQNPYRGLIKELKEKFNVDSKVIYKARDGAYDDWSEPLTLNDIEKRRNILITPK